MSTAAIDETALRPQVLKAWRQFQQIKVRVDGAFDGRPVLVSDRFFVREFVPKLRTLAGEVAITSGAAEEQVRQAIDAELERVLRRQQLVRHLGKRAFRRSDIAAAAICLQLDRLTPLGQRRGLVALAVRQHALLVLRDVAEFTEAGRSTDTRSGAFSMLDSLLPMIEGRIEAGAAHPSPDSVSALLALIPALVVERSAVVLHPFTLQAIETALQRGLTWVPAENAATVRASIERIGLRREAVMERREQADLDTIVHDTAASLLRRNKELDDMLNELGRFSRRSPDDQQQERTKFLLWTWKMSELHVQMMRLMTTDPEQLRPMVTDIHAMIGRGHRVAMVLGAL